MQGIFEGQRPLAVEYLSAKFEAEFGRAVATLKRWLSPCSVHLSMLCQENLLIREVRRQSICTGEREKSGFRNDAYKSLPAGLRGVCAAPRTCFGNLELVYRVAVICYRGKVPLESEEAPAK